MRRFHTHFAKGNYKKIYDDSGGALHKMRTKSAFRDEMTAAKARYGDFRYVANYTMDINDSGPKTVKVYCSTYFTKARVKEEFLYTGQEHKFLLQYYKVSTEP